jgi:hypothetical protein
MSRLLSAAAMAADTSRLAKALLIVLALSVNGSVNARAAGPQGGLRLLSPLVGHIMYVNATGSGVQRYDLVEVDDSQITVMRNGIERVLTICH